MSTKKLLTCFYWSFLAVFTVDTFLNFGKDIQQLAFLSFIISFSFAIFYTIFQILNWRNSKFLKLFWIHILFMFVIWIWGSYVLLTFAVIKIIQNYDLNLLITFLVIFKLIIQFSLAFSIAFYLVHKKIILKELNSAKRDFNIFIEVIKKQKIIYENISKISKKTILINYINRMNPISISPIK